MGVKETKSNIMRDIHISIISHHQFEMVQDVLLDFEKQGCADRIRVTITINVPEKISTHMECLSFPVDIINNDHPKGFSANHNASFNQPIIAKERQFFLVINPDVRLIENVIKPLINVLEANESVGLTAPMVHGVDNVLEDSVRELPTPVRIIAKLFGGQGRLENDRCTQPDWVAGMFMAFRASVFEQIGGFDENYFLYYEDVDICSRLWLAGYQIHFNENVSIVHDAQRKSWRDIRYLRWHIASMLRFFNSDVCRRITMFHQKRIESTISQ